MGGSCQVGDCSVGSLFYFADVFFPGEFVIHYDSKDFHGTGCFDPFNFISVVNLYMDFFGLSFSAEDHHLRFCGVYL